MRHGVDVVDLLNDPGNLLMPDLDADRRRRPGAVRRRRRRRRRPCWQPHPLLLQPTRATTQNDN